PGSKSISHHSYGMNYHPQSDALIGVTGDGRIYALDRQTGMPILPVPFELPGEKSPEKELTFIDILPQGIKDRIRAELEPLIGGSPFDDPVIAISQVLLGGGTEVANFFSVDPSTGRMWVAATAPDAEDGTVDEISEYGALYGLDLITDDGPPHIVEACHRYFQGGSASTPTLLADGSKVYVGDAEGGLIAIDSSCNEVWSLGIGNQVVGSVGVASDNGEIYVATAKDIVKVIDRGDHGEEIWRAVLDMYRTGLLLDNFNVNLATIGANGVFIEVGSGVLVEDLLPLELGLPFKVGGAVLDRETGAIRYFADGIEETVSVMNISPEGALYLGHSPVRRAFARGVFPDFTHPLTGGVGKYAPLRQDLLIRDAACAAFDRAQNASFYEGFCPDSADADVVQIQDLIDQCRRVAPGAIIDGDLSQGEWDMIEGFLADAEAMLVDNLPFAALHLVEACDFF
ncbi:PQQ-binding-like beta-propeller repeat protein, partial [Thermodesulfobacteriota bacterium]